MPGAGTQQRRAASSTPREPLGQVRVERGLRGPGLSGQPTAVEPVGDRRRAARPSRVDVDSSAPRASSQAVTAHGMALTPPGSTHEPCPRWPGSRVRSAAARAASTRRAQPSIASCRSASAVVPAWLASPGKSSRHRPCGQMSVPTPTGWPRSIRPRPCSTCSSTKLPIRRSVSGSGPIRPGRRPARRAAPRPCVIPSASVSAQRPVGGQRAGDHPRAGAGDAEPGALLVDEVDHPDRPAGPNPRSRSAIDRGEGADHAQRAVERAAVGHAVQVRAGDHARARWSGSPHQAHWLPIRSSTRSSPRAARLAGEPLAQLADRHAVQANRR